LSLQTYHHHYKLIIIITNLSLSLKAIISTIFLIAGWIAYRRNQQNRLQQEVSSILFEYSPVSSVEMEAVFNSNLKETLVV
jgi:hypothetical protein